MNAYEDIIHYGKKIVEQGLATSFFGNLSIRDGERIVITRTGTMLDELTHGDLVSVTATDTCPDDASASSELVVHRAAMAATGCNAVLHCHAMYAMLMGEYDTDSCSFAAAEVLAFLSSVPIVSGKSGTVELANAVASGLQKNPVIVVRDHGVFACGPSMKQCWIYTTSLEHHARERVLKTLVQSALSR